MQQTFLFYFFNQTIYVDPDIILAQIDGCSGIGQGVDFYLSVIYYALYMCVVYTQALQSGIC